MTLPLAHVGHYLWVLYLLPVVIVVAGIVRSTVMQRQRLRGEKDSTRRFLDDDRNQ